MDYAVKQSNFEAKTEVSEMEFQLAPLSELQLALVGGGVGEVIFPN